MNLTLLLGLALADDNFAERAHLTPEFEMNIRAELASKVLRTLKSKPFSTNFTN